MVTRPVQKNKIQEKILNAASQLFYEKDLQAVSIDDIVLKANVAKMTFYNYFTSKDKLIITLVERSEKLWWDWFTTELHRRNKLAQRQLLAIFDLLFDSFGQGIYKSKLFINTRIRVVETMYPIFLISETFINRLRDFILDIVKLTNLAKPHQVTEQFILLVIGLIALSDFDNTKSSKLPFHSAKKVALLIIASAEQKA